MAGSGRDAQGGGQASRPRAFVFWSANAFLMGAILAFYAWSLHDPTAFTLTERRSDYYSLQVHGWAKGSLALDAAPHPDLRVEYPNRITQNAPYLLDASYYQGRYHLYFGPVPALVLMLPYHLLTGNDLPESFVALAFTAAGFLLSIIWLWIILGSHPRLAPSRRWFPLAILALGLATAAPATLTRPLFYEVAIGAGYAFTQASLLALVLAFLRPASACRWLACAGLFAGLAAGSRPNLLVGAAVVLALAALVVMRHRGERSLRAATRHLAAAGLPLALVAAALLAYNYARFDHALEFGNKLQLGANPEGFGFTLASFWHNLTLYYFTPPAFDVYFPFIGPGTEPMRPPGYFGVEELNGQFVLMPAILAALVWGLCAARARSAKGGTIGALLAVIALGSLTNFCLVASTGVRANRYVLDFQPAIVALIAIAMASLATERTAPLRWLGRGIALVLFLAALFNGFASLQAGSRFRLQDPAGYAAMEVLANRLAAPLAQALAPEPGDQRFAITFPENARHQIEPLLVAGFSTGHDALSIEFLEIGRARLMFDHSRHGPVYGPEFSYVPGAESELRVHLGTLHPPVGHPWYRDLPVEVQHALRHRAFVWLDGKPILTASSVTHIASMARIELGQRWFYAKGAASFSGRLEHLGGDQIPQDASADAFKAVVVRFPRDMQGQREPLLTFGNSAVRQGDAIFVEYRESGMIRFGYDSGGELTFSPDVAIEPDALHRLDLAVREGTRGGSRPGAIRITLNGDAVWSAPFWNRTIADAVWIPFANPDLSTACRSQFTGVFYALGPGPAPSDSDPVRFALPSFILGSGESEPATVTAVASWTQPSGERASLGIEKDGEGNDQFVWRESGSEVSAPFSLSGSEVGRLMLVPDEEGFVLLHGADVILRHRTPFFLRGSPDFWIGGDSPAMGSFRSHGHMVMRPRARESRGAVRAVDAEGKTRLTVVLPRNKVGAREPLLVAGISGKADAVYAHYVDPDHIVLGFDHWGGPGAESPPISVDYERGLQIDLGFSPPVQGETGQSSIMEVKLDGAVVWTTPVVLHPHPPGAWKVGENTVGLSTSSERFTGIILESALEP